MTPPKEILIWAGRLMHGNGALSVLDGSRVTGTDGEASF
jgi:hypothetical protein